MKNYIRSLVVISLVSVFNFELRANPLSEAAKAGAASKEISDKTQGKYGHLLPNGEFIEHIKDPSMQLKILNNKEPAEVANALLESINKKFDACRSINIKNEIQESINSYVLTKDFGKINVTDQTLNQRKEALKADVYQNLNNKLNEIKNDANPPAGIAENYDLISNIIKDSSSNK